MLEAVLIGWDGPWSGERFFLGMALICIPLLGFIAALVSRKIYGGALSDPNGIPLARIAIFGKPRYVDWNLVAVWPPSWCWRRPWRFTTPENAAH